jgi:hypothetical protein
MINLTKAFDWLSYVAIVEMIYGVDADDEKAVVAVDAKPFREFLKNWHSKSYLQIRDKLKEILSYIKSKNLDILFMQEAGKVEWAQHIPNDYDFTKNADSVIIFKKKLRENAQHWSD